MDTADLEPLRLSRDLEAVFRRYQVTLGLARRAEPVLDPFGGRLFPGKLHYDAVLGMPEADPLRMPLLRWIHELIRARVQLPWTLLALAREHREPVSVHEPRPGRHSLAEIRRWALASLGAERRSWITTRNAVSESMASVYLEWCARLPEIDRRLQASGHVLEPLEDLDSCLSVARTVLERTQDGVVSARGLDEISVFEELMMTASDGWPARLKPDTLVDLLDARSWLSRFDLKIENLPERLNPASFLLGLGALGHCFSLARMRVDLPFVVVRTPGDLAHQIARELFALIPLGAPFLERRLNLGAAKLARVRRSLSLVVLLELRRRAARTLLYHAACSGQQQARDQAEDLAPRLSQVPWSVDALLGRLLSDEAPERRFVALLEAGAQSCEARNVYDEDWFKNPRFRERFLDDGQSVPAATVPIQRLKECAFPWIDELLRAL